MIFGLLPLIVLGGIIWLIVRAVSGRPTPGAERPPAGTSVRRFFQYVGLFGLLVVVAIGLTGLITEILPDGDTIARADEAALARSLSFVLVGVPTFIGLAWWTRRELEDNEAERASFGWAFYLTATMLTALMTAAVASYGVLLAVFAVEDFAAGALATMVVWGAVWAVHWRLATDWAPIERLQFHRLAGSAAGLATTVTAVGFGLSVALSSIYEDLFDTSIAATTGDDALRATAGFLVGAAIWWWYWLRNAALDDRTAVWHGYVLLFGVLVGLITAVVATGTILFTALVWFFGNPESSRAAAHFDVLPGAISAIVVGVWVWWYHRAVLRTAGDGTRTDVDRVYDYVVAAVGLIAATGGVTTVVVALIEALTPEGIVDGGASAANTLIAAITLLLVGGPIWWFTWSGIQRRTDDVEELRSPVRRIALFFLFGAGGVVAVTSLLTLFYLAIEDIIEGTFGAETVRDIRVPLALVVTLGALAAYHWIVYREDRRRLPAELVPEVRDVILLGVENGAAEAITSRTKARVEVWHRLDGREIDEAAAIPIDDLIEQILASHHEHVMVVANESGFEVVPYER